MALHDTNRQSLNNHVTITKEMRRLLTVKATLAKGLEMRCSSTMCRNRSYSTSAAVYTPLCTCSHIALSVSVRSLK